MRKPYTDAKYEVVTGPTQDILPQWFKTLMLWLAALMLLGLPIWKFNESHRPSPQAEAGGSVAPQAPSAR